MAGRHTAGDRQKLFEGPRSRSDGRTAWRAPPTGGGPAHLTMGSLVRGTGSRARPSGRVMSSIVPGHLEVELSRLWVTSFFSGDKHEIKVNYTKVKVGIFYFISFYFTLFHFRKSKILKPTPNTSMSPVFWQQ